jgi:alpha-L-fucosidase
MIQTKGRWLACLLVTLFLPLCAVGSKDFEPARQRTKLLAEWESLKYGMFIHYGMSTFADGNWQTSPPAKAYAPSRLDVRQWIRVARQAGMRYAVLTAKHVAGHCLWDSKDYEYDVANSSDTTEVVAEFMAACKAEGIKPGLYYCVLDNYNEEGVKWEAAVSPAYFELIKRHLTELHERYPGVFEQWIDIPAKLSSEQRTELYRLIKRLSPNCIVMMNQGFRDGQIIPEGGWPTDLTDGEKTLPPPAGHNPRKSVNGKDYYIPMEVCDTIGERWFSAPNDPPRSLKTLYRLYSRSVSRNANLLLNVPPDRTGRIPQDAVDRLMELKAVIEAPTLLPPPESLTFDRPAKASNVYRKMSAHSAEAAVDDDLGTRWATDASIHEAWLEVDLGEPRTFNRAFISEEYDRVQSFELQYRRGEEWRTFARGNKIGNELTLEFEPVTARVVRLNVLQAIDGPTIWEFQLFSPRN